MHSNYKVPTMACQSGLALSLPLSPYFQLHFPSLTLLQPHWFPCCSLTINLRSQHRPSPCQKLCPESFRFTLSLPYFPQVSVLMPLSSERGSHIPSYETFSFALFILWCSDDRQCNVSYSNLFAYCLSLLCYKVISRNARNFSILSLWIIF